jgi:hypothetical protein
MNNKLFLYPPVSVARTNRLEGKPCVRQISDNACVIVNKPHSQNPHQSNLARELNSSAWCVITQKNAVLSFFEMEAYNQAILARSRNKVPRFTHSQMRGLKTNSQKNPVTPNCSSTKSEF